MTFVVRFSALYNDIPPCESLKINSLSENNKKLIQKKLNGLKLILPDIHVPLNLDAGGSFKNMSSKLGFTPLILGDSSGGETRIILKTISPKTAAITSRAINIPRQFRSLGEFTTNSCKKKLKD